jgi:sec-independent protein translocase protein TatC
MPLIDTPASFWQHIEELRQTIIRVLYTVACGIGISFYYYQEILSFLISPSIEIQRGLVVLGPLDGFLTALKTSFWVGLVVTSPLWTFLTMRFIAPALQPKERKWVIPFILFSLIFMSLGVAFSYYITIPLANQFLSSFNEEIGVNMWTLSSYLDYTLILLLSNALAFEISVFLLFLVHYGAISASRLSDLRKYAIVAIFIISAILTPPDVFTQFMLAIPLMIIYELAIIYAKIRSAGHKNNSDSSQE